MYAHGKCRQLGLPKDLQIELFDRMIVPIMFMVVRCGDQNTTKKLKNYFLNV